MKFGRAPTIDTIFFDTDGSFTLDKVSTLLDFAFYDTDVYTIAIIR